MLTYSTSLRGAERRSNPPPLCRGLLRFARNDTIDDELTYLTVGIISLLECVLAPLWVWLAFAETPDERTFAGGAVVLGAVALSVTRMRRPSR